jgi:hypothetical protein
LEEKRRPFSPSFFISIHLFHSRTNMFFLRCANSNSNVHST